MSRLAIFLLVFSASALAAKLPPAPRDIARTAAALNAQSKSQLGVGLFSLSLLAEAGPGHFFPKQMLEHNGSWPMYQELEKAGYVTLKVATGLPDGSAATTEFVSVTLTDSGQRLLTALLGP
jgi:hypothetical protein